MNQRLIHSIGFMEDRPKEREMSEARDEENV